MKMRLCLILLFASLFSGLRAEPVLIENAGGWQIFRQVESHYARYPDLYPPFYCFAKAESDHAQELILRVPSDTSFMRVELPLINVPIHTVVGYIDFRVDVIAFFYSNSNIGMYVPSQMPVELAQLTAAQGYALLGEFQKVGDFDVATRRYVLHKFEGLDNNAMVQALLTCIDKDLEDFNHEP